MTMDLDEITGSALHRVRSSSHDMSHDMSK